MLPARIIGRLGQILYVKYRQSRSLNTLSSFYIAYVTPRVTPRQGHTTRTRRELCEFASRFPALFVLALVLESDCVECACVHFTWNPVVAAAALPAQALSSLNRTLWWGC
jgi:hypothetical protein